MRKYVYNAHMLCLKMSQNRTKNKKKKENSKKKNFSPKGIQLYYYIIY